MKILLKKSLATILIAVMAIGYNIEKPVVQEMLSPRTFAPIITYGWEHLFYQDTTAQQISENLVLLAPTITSRRSLEILAQNLGAVPAYVLTDEQKIDLFESVLKLSPANPLTQDSYQFVRNRFFIPLILKEEAMLLKERHKEIENKTIEILDIGSGNGSILWLLRQTLTAIGLPQHKVVVVEPSEKKRTLSKELHPDIPTDFYFSQPVDSPQWLDTYFEGSEINEALPFTFDLVLFQHSLHEIYTDAFKKERDHEAGLNAVGNAFFIVSELTNKQSIVHIQDGILPEDGDEQITITFKQNKTPSLEVAWFDFLKIKEQLGLADEKVGLGMEPFSYIVSKRLYTHFLTKAWYLAESSQDKGIQDHAQHELAQVSSFATFEEMVEQLSENEFQPIFSLQIREHTHTDYINERVRAQTIEGLPYTPWQFTGFLATKGSLTPKKDFTPTLKTVDGPNRNWFDSYEYRQGKQKLDTQMFLGMQDRANKLIWNILNFYTFMQIKKLDHLFSKELLEKLESFKRDIYSLKKLTSFIIQWDDRPQDSPFSISELTALSESYLFFKMDYIDLVDEVFNEVKEKKHSNSDLEELLKPLKPLARTKRDFTRYFDKEDAALEMWSHKNFFKKTIGESTQEQFGWMKHHPDFQTGHPFSYKWKLEEDMLPFDLEIFRTMLYSLFFIAKENAIAPNRDTNLSPLQITVKKEKKKLHIEIKFKVDSTQARTASNQENILFAKQVAKYLNGDFLYQEHGYEGTIAFILPYPQAESEKELPEYLKLEQERYTGTTADSI